MPELDARHGITRDIETLDIRNSSEALKRMKQSDVLYRLVLDITTLCDV
ncbi:MAG: hypothetical protein AAFY46_07830 [Planctomycetota bacterium]